MTSREWLQSGELDSLHPLWVSPAGPTPNLICLNPRPVDSQLLAGLGALLVPTGLTARPLNPCPGRTLSLLSCRPWGAAGAP